MLSAFAESQNSKSADENNNARQHSRFLVHMPGCGGELVARCLQEMRSVAAKQILAGDPDQLARIEAEKIADLLTVLRIAVPWQSTPSEVESNVWRPLEDGQYRLAVVRHPLQAWLGLQARDPGMNDDQMANYFAGFHAFAEGAAKHGFVTYEGLCRHPILMLRTICELLKLPYDDAFGKTYLQNEQLDGVIGTEHSSMIHLRKRRPEHTIIDAACAMPEFARILDLLGYPDPTG